jgi:hypothetical protein
MRYLLLAAIAAITCIAFAGAPVPVDQAVAQQPTPASLSTTCRVQCPGGPLTASARVECRAISGEQCRSFAAANANCRADVVFESWCTSQTPTASTN